MRMGGGMGLRGGGGGGGVFGGGGGLGGMGAGRGRGLGSRLRAGPMGRHEEFDDEPDQRPLDLKLITRLLRYTRSYATKRNALVFLVLLRSVQLPTTVAILWWVIRGPIAQGDVRGTFWGAAAFAAFALFTQFTFHFRMRLAQELGEQVVHDLRRDMFARLQVLTKSYFDRMQLGRIISRFLSDADSVRVGVQDVLFVTLVQVGQGLMAAVFMAWADWRLFCIVLAMSPVLWGINHVFRKPLSRAYREVQESFSRVTSTLVESVVGIRVTQMFVRQEVNAQAFADLVEDHTEYNMRVARVSGGLISLLEFNTQVFTAVLVTLAGYLALRSSTTPAEARAIAVNLPGFFFMATLFFEPVRVFGRVYNEALTAMAGAERVFKLLDAQPDWADPPDAVELPPIQGRVEFRDVGFEYVPGKRVLEEVSFTANPGETVALVGHTGSGKTTIVNLISKFYLPNEGRILVDGHDLVGTSTQSLHRQMGIVLQVNFLFTGTAMENIRVGKPQATDQEVVEAARRLDVLDLLEALPEGFATSVGEGGKNMSLGQRQLICFTRAMLADPRILILDEATSSVDAMTEARVQRALAVLLKGRTSFVVAHRLSTIRQASQILVLDHGQIVERGTHRQLLATGGVYAHLYRRFIRPGHAR